VISEQYRLRGGWAPFQSDHSWNWQDNIVPPEKQYDRGPVRKQMDELEAIKSPIKKYLSLRRLEEQANNLFHKMLQQNVTYLLPYVYTPTVGEACVKWNQLLIQPHGLYITLEDKGKIKDKLKAWPNQEIKVIVVTDGERILGLGDLGNGGMGISEGKILLYSAIGGVSPATCLPVMIDIGTNNKDLLDDPKYPGVRKPRITGQEYMEFIDEFITAVKEWQPHCFVQFEDFANHNAFTLLDKYRENTPCFNDDIQGTATIGLAGILAALRKNQGDLDDQKFLFFGAGEAATGIASLVAMALTRWYGIPLEEARKRCILFDSKGVVTKARKDRGGLQAHKVAFAHDIEFKDPNNPPNSLLNAIKEIKPTALIGSAVRPGAFDKNVIQEMSKINQNPIIFPLSNPTDKAECTFADAFKWSKGKVSFASGSPFPPVRDENNITHYAAQANNAYIFPSVGHAAVLTKAKSIPDDVMLEMARMLSRMSPEKDLQLGLLFPPLHQIREVSIMLIAGACLEICRRKLQGRPGVGERTLEEWEAEVRREMFELPDDLAKRKARISFKELGHGK